MPDANRPTQRAGMDGAILCSSRTRVGAPYRLRPSGRPSTPTCDLPSRCASARVSPSERMVRTCALRIVKSKCVAITESALVEVTDVVHYRAISSCHYGRTAGPGSTNRVSEITRPPVGDSADAPRTRANGQRLIIGTRLPERRQHIRQSDPVKRESGRWRACDGPGRL